MFFLYCTILLLPFQDHPHLGVALFHVGFLVFTPIKLLAIPMLVVAFIGPRPPDAARHRPTRVPLLYLAFAGYLLLIVFALGVPVPGHSTSQLIEFGLLFIGIRALVVNQVRFIGTIRMIVVAELIGSLWIYKQYYLLHYPRPIGPSSDQNYEALALAMTIPLAIYLAYRDKSRNWRRFAFGSALLMSFGIFLLQSRGGLLALTVLLIAGWSMVPNKGRNLALAAALVGAMALATPRTTWQRIRDISMSGQPTSGAGLSTESRVELAKAGLKMMVTNPIFGVGLEQFGRLAVQYNRVLGDMAPNVIGMVHNTYVEIGASGGVPALALFLALLIVANRDYKEVQRQGASAEGLPDLALAMRMSLLAYAVAAAFLTAWMQKELWMIVFLAPNLLEIAVPSTKRSFAWQRLPGPQTDAIAG